MRYYLDTNIVIYAVEGQAPFQLRARDHIALLENAGQGLGIGELTWTDCLVWPFRTGDGPLLLEYQRFLLGPNLTTVHATPAVHQRAAMIRAIHSFGLADSLHHATAVELRFDRFLTNDARLARFTEIIVEILP